VATKIRLKESGLLPRRIRLRLKARRKMKTINKYFKQCDWQPKRGPLFDPGMRTCFISPAFERSYGSPMEHQESIMKFGSMMDDFEDSVDAALNEIEKSVAKLPEKDREVQARILWKDQRHQYKKPTLIHLWHEDVTAEDMDAESEWDEFKNLMKSRDERLKEKLDWVESILCKYARDRASETS